MSKSRITGWVLSGLLSALLIFASASGKFTQWEGKAEMFAKLGWAEEVFYRRLHSVVEEVMFKIGVVEVAIAVLFLIPRVAFLAAILLSAYLGGAVATHVRVADPFFTPIIVGVVAWIALGLRDPRVFALAFQSNHRACPVKTSST